MRCGPGIQLVSEELPHLEGGELTIAGIGVELVVWKCGSSVEMAQFAPVGGVQLGGFFRSWKPKSQRRLAGSGWQVGPVGGCQDLWHLFWSVLGCYHI